MTTFKALESSKGENQNTLSIIERSINDLPEGDLLIKVNYSSLNYKDALSASGSPGVTRNYPHTPGIDAVGNVQESNNPNFKEGDTVIVTGYDLGMDTSGGFGQYIRVPADWAISLPSGLSEVEAMSLGTAGLPIQTVDSERLVHQDKDHRAELDLLESTTGVLLGQGETATHSDFPVRPQCAYRGVGQRTRL